MQGKNSCIDIYILVTSRIGDRKAMPFITKISAPATEIESVQPVQINNYQNNAIRKHLNWLDFEDQPRFQEMLVP